VSFAHKAVEIGACWGIGLGRRPKVFLFGYVFEAVNKLSLTVVNEEFIVRKSLLLN